MSDRQGTQSALTVSAALSSQHPGTCSSVSPQFLSTTPLQRCVVESRHGHRTLRSLDLLILKLDHLSGWELLASMALEGKHPAFILLVLSHIGSMGLP